MSNANPERVPFELYPAIDILGGACVRLHKGDYAEKTEYAADPSMVAQRWLAAGTKWLHVVDLDGAKSGSAVNRDVISKVVDVAKAAGAKVQVGGGIRTHAAVEAWLAAGVTRCVIGTAALEPGWMATAVKQFGADSVIVGLDGRDGKMAVRGWIEQTDVPLVEVAERLAADGVRWALVTDVSRDGTLAGANVDLPAEIQAATGIACLASGGVRDLTDVLAAREAGLAGAILGKSLYDGTLDLGSAFEAVSGR